VTGTARAAVPHRRRTLWRRAVGPLYRGPRTAVQVTYARVGEATAFESPGSLVLDARDVRDMDSLREAHETVKGWVRSLRRAEALRFVLVLRQTQDAPLAFACSEALVQHAWSAAREIGPRFGATCNVLRLDHWSTAADSALKFLLSGRAACVSRTDLSVPPPRERAHDDVANADVGMDDEHSSVRGLRCVVTGAAGGIGRAVAETLALRGARLALVDSQPERVGGAERAPYRRVDFLKHNSFAAEIRDFALKALGGVDVVAHVAGLTRDRTLKKMTAQDWNDVLDVNFAAPLAIDSVLRPSTSVLFSSVVGLTGNLGQANYAAAKSALRTFAAATSSSSASDYSDEVNYRVVAPGFVDTPMTRNLPWLQRFLGARFASTLQQPVLPVDVANAAAFLASPKSAALRGQTLRVCGGFLYG